jgi:hypothetical protein
MGIDAAISTFGRHARAPPPLEPGRFGTNIREVSRRPRLQRLDGVDSSTCPDRPAMTIARACPLILCLVAPVALAATTCPLIRPAGLTPSQVDEVVVSDYARWLRKPASAIELARPFKPQDGSANEPVDFLLATQAIVVDLGVDFGKDVFDAARAQGPATPDESVTIAQIQAIARAAYAQGSDGPPPAAAPGVDYAVVKVPVHVPAAPAGDWRLVRCGHDDVTFRMERADGVFAASLRNASLRPFTSDAAFLQDAQDAFGSQLPAGFQPRPWKFAMVAGTARRCADATQVADNAQAGTSYLLRVRVCALAPNNPNTHVLLFSQMAARGQAVDATAAEAFIAATSPK